MPGGTLRRPAPSAGSGPGRAVHPAVSVSPGARRSPPWRLFLLPPLASALLSGLDGGGRW